MRKKTYIFLTFLLFIAIFTPFATHAESSKTKLGVFFLPSPELFEQAQLKVTRKILKDFEIEKLYEQLDSGKQTGQIKQLKTLQAFKDAGVDIIITLRWPLDNSLFTQKTDMINGKINQKSMIDRVPQGEDRTRTLKLLQRFINDFGKWIDVISLQNEVLGGPGQYRDQDTMRAPGEFSPAGQWLIHVAKTVRSTIQSNPKLSHLKISSPVWPASANFAAKNIMIPEYHKSPKIRFFGEIIKISNTYCDYVDIHTLVMSIKDLPQFIAYIKKHTHLPLITTEWAGLYGVRKWMKKTVDPSVIAHIKHNIQNIKRKTNEQLIRFAHKKKVPLKVWNNFLRTMPHEKDFTLKSFRLFEQEGFAYACWALGYQYNNLFFDLNTLFANIVTKDRHAPNGPAFEDFQRVIKYSGGTPWEF